MSAENPVKNKNEILFQEIANALSEAEVLFDREEREAVKPYLVTITSRLIKENHPSGWGEDIIDPLRDWNPKGNLTKEQYDFLSLRRKKLSNAVGIMTASGIVRHDLNKI